MEKLLLFLSEDVLVKLNFVDHLVQAICCGIT